MTKTAKNTLKSILVLFIIASVSVLLLAIANNFIKVEIKADAKTVALINSIAPTGVSDDEAFKNKHVKLVKLEEENYKIKDIDSFNKTFANPSVRVRALYTSYNIKTKTITFVVESSGTGYENGEIVMLTAYDAQNKISGVVAKAQNQSYWGKLAEHTSGGLPAFYNTFIGKSGAITSKDIASSTGATIMGTLGGITSAVSIANEFVAQLGGIQKLPPAPVTDAGIIANLKKVSDATAFTKHDEKLPNKITAVYVGDNGDIIYESIASVGDFGSVKMLVKATADKKVAKLSLTDSNFTPKLEHDSSALKQDATLNAYFIGKNIADINKDINNGIAGTTHVTDSNKGLKKAVINALEYIDTFAEVIK